MIESRSNQIKPKLEGSPVDDLIGRFDLVFKTNVLKTGPMTEPEKLPVHGSLVGPMVKPRLNR